MMKMVLVVMRLKPAVADGAAVKRLHRRVDGVKRSRRTLESAEAACKMENHDRCIPGNHNLPIFHNYVPIDTILS